MADNVAITAGSGTTIAADDIGGGVLVQRVKAVLGADGTGIDPSAGNGVSGTGVQRVTIASDSTGVVGLNAGTNLIGTTTGFQTTITQTITRPANTTTYAVSDVLADVAATAGGDTLTSMGRVSGGSGVTTDALFIFDEIVATALQGELWIWDTAVTAVADNAAFTFSDAEMRTLVAKIPFALTVVGANSQAHVQNLNIAYTCVGSANLRSYIRTLNAYVPSTNSSVLTVRLKVMQTT